MTVALRSVNGRYLDLNTRLREPYRELEAKLRETLGEGLQRGRVEVGVEIQTVGQRKAVIDLDLDLARALADANRQLVDDGLIVGAPSLEHLLRLPEAVRVQSEEIEWSDEDTECLLRVARTALEELLEARAHEGEKLSGALLERIAKLETLESEVRALRPKIQSEAAEAFKARIQELVADVEVEPGRLEQEVALLTERGDVSEEIDRFASHLEHFRDVAAGEGALGKRLDFLIQEMVRELNTLGSKCRHPDVVRRVLDGKVLCEELREQVQNVE